ncbi:hypothetical protein BV133_2796 [Blastochloris viridis]|uniref:Uncharacterized protein n=1 Tax=Blastochloris viridis TaxID=1079 RepID=A0A182D4L7_BLAVI|nr:hypothetical protein BV133_2796 [Blastochloris viridis]
MLETGVMGDQAAFVDDVSVTSYPSANLTPSTREVAPAI